MSLEHLSPREIQKMCDAPIYERGVEYYQSGAVIDRRLAGDSVTATVMGTQDYRVEVGKGMHFRCSCPFEFSGPCKHVVALLLAWNEQPETFAAPHPHARNLIGKSRAELQNLLLRALTEYPDLVRKLGLDAPKA